MGRNKNIYQRLKENSKPSEEEILRIKDYGDLGFVYSMKHADEILPEE